MRRSSSRNSSAVHSESLAGSPVSVVSTHRARSVSIQLPELMLYDRGSDTSSSATDTDADDERRDTASNSGSNSEPDVGEEKPTTSLYDATSQHDVTAMHEATSVHDVTPVRDDMSVRDVTSVRDITSM